MPLTRREFASGMAATTIALHPFSANATAGQAHLRLMETTDLHVHVYPYDYYADRQNDTMGLARTAAIIRSIRAEAANALLIDNGDFLQGNPMGDYIAYERGMKDGDVHPIIKGMNALDFACSTLGNHEFNYGLDFMTKVLAGAKFPFVCANLVNGAVLAGNPRNDKLFLEPYLILERLVQDGTGQNHPVKVGLIGFVPPQIMTWDSRHLDGKVMTRDIVAAARAFVPQMREEGADIIVALAHSGIDPRTAEGQENAALQLAAVDGIDAVLTGHQHLTFPTNKDFKPSPGVDPQKGTLHGKPAVMAGFWGSHLGLIDLLLEKQDRWRVVKAASEARPISRREGSKTSALVESDQKVLEPVKADHEATLAYVRRPVGKTSAPLYSFFALVADDPSVQIVSQAQSWYMATMMKSGRWAGLPILSAAAPFKAGGRGGPDYYTDVPAGSVAIKNVADLYLYPNTIRAVLVTGAIVKEWLERSAGMFNRIEPGKADQPLLNASFPTYNFDVIDGVSYKIDLTQSSKYGNNGEMLDASASRIVDLRFDGRPIDAAQKFVVATNNYRAAGGGNFPGVNNDSTIFVGPDTNRDILVRYIVEQGTINPTADGNWSFAPIAGATALFETSPKARDRMGEVKGVRLAYVGEGAAGFARFQVIF